MTIYKTVTDIIVRGIWLTIPVVLYKSRAAFVIPDMLFIGHFPYVKDLIALEHKHLANLIALYTFYHCFYNWILGGYKNTSWTSFIMSTIPGSVLTFAIALSLAGVEKYVVHNFGLEKYAPGFGRTVYTLIYGIAVYAIIKIACGHISQRHRAGSEVMDNAEPSISMYPPGMEIDLVLEKLKSTEKSAQEAPQIAKYKWHQQG
ncbi:hypothetical protein P280DRAFT_543257 [Massarina eburnea CBS 473.64]|uniref:Uncharacterized protein n=1 Tax=Massarina eburnea CBS 473.64 TaxID=1395130 RepID=A0A6A6S2E0_9PLEO|nr:hypothetical protein P280DRAFT_543257 [Massarina eburnea CBS 473.64]